MRHPGRLESADGLTLTEIMLVVAILVILIVVALPGLRRAIVKGNEASAIGSLRAIHRGQNAFLNSCGGGYYSPSLTNLGRGLAGQPPGFINEDLSWTDTVNKRGYYVTIVPAEVEPASPPSCNGLGAGSLVRGYSALAWPGGLDSGTRYFVTNSGGAIYEAAEKLPAWQGGPPPAGATPVQ